MYKNMKKLTAIFLAVLLGVSTMTTVFAEEIPEDKLFTEEIAESGKNQITGQSGDMEVKAGETATFTVSASGMVRSYQWQVSKDGGKKWKKLDAKTDTLSIEATAEKNGWLYRCAVTYKTFKVEYSEPVLLSVSKDVTYPVASFESEAVNGVTIHVEAPEGALPEGTTMEVGKVDLKAVQAAVDNAGLEGTVLAALDITFFDVEGAKIEPNGDIKVTMESEEIAKAENPVVIHLPASAEEIEKAVVAPEKIDAEFELNKVTFEADQFSVYAVVDEGDTGDEARATVNFYGLNDAVVATYYVKNSDVMPPADDADRDPEASYLDHIVTDPGVGGQVPSGQIFLGISARRKIIPQRRLR